jgi:YD repeat-containing protein
MARKPRVHCQDGFYHVMPRGNAGEEIFASPQVADSAGTITFAYDILKRLTSLTDVYNKTIFYGYGKDGNLATLTYPGSNVVSYEYEKADRLVPEE